MHQSGRLVNCTQSPREALIAFISWYPCPCVFPSHTESRLTLSTTEYWSSDNEWLKRLLQQTFASSAIVSWTAHSREASHGQHCGGVYGERTWHLPKARTRVPPCDWATQKELFQPLSSLWATSASTSNGWTNQPQVKTTQMSCSGIPDS